MALAKKPGRFFTLTIFVISIWGLSYYASRLLQKDMEHLLGEQQFSTASLLASQLNQELADRLSALEDLAKGIHPAMMYSPSSLQTLIEQHQFLQNLFNEGVRVAGPDGVVIASDPLEPGRIGLNLMDRDYLIGPLKEGRPTIGRPVMGKATTSPIIVMSVPVRDIQGQVIGALIGVTNLSKPNFLDHVTDSRYGKTGGYFINSPQHQLIITATDKTRIMEPLPAPGINPTLDRWSQGFFDSAIFVNPKGVEVLGSAKDIPLAGWFVSSALPTTEAFEPLRAMQQRILLATLLLTLITGGLSWWWLRRQLSPLLTATNALSTPLDENLPPQPLPVTRNDEIGMLIEGFNRLLKVLSEREELLKESENHFRDIFDEAPIGYYEFDSEGRIVSVNRAELEILGYTREEMLGRYVWEFLEDIEFCRKSVLSKLAGHSNSVQTTDFERNYLKKDGTPVQLLIKDKILRDNKGKITGIRSTAMDITDRKLVSDAVRKSENQFREIFDDAPISYHEYDSEGRITRVNQTELTNLGYSKDEMLGHYVWEFVEKSELSRHSVLDKLAGISVPTSNYERNYLKKNGIPIPVLIKDRILRDDAGNITGVRTAAMDITDQKRADEILRLSEERYRVIFQTSTDVISLNQLSDGLFIDVNQAFVDTQGYSREETLGHTSAELNIWVDPEERNRYTELLHRDSKCSNIEARFRTKSGEVIWGLVSAAVIELDGTPCVMSVRRNITERKQAEEKINHLAFFDQLTELPNRTLLQDRLKQAMAGSLRSGCFGALLLIDLDYFKNLNDTLGHDMGDILLKQVAQRLTDCVREEDTVARQGGDEFVVMLVNLSENQGEAAALIELIGEKIIAALNQPFALKALTYNITSSIGASVFLGQQTNIDTLLKQADLAMYKAKEAGRNTLRFFDPDMAFNVLKRAALDNDLREARQNKQFVLHYQAQVSGGQVIGAEALLRRQHPVRGLVFPGEFIPVIEETGLILPIGQWVLESACKQLADWATQPDMSHLTVAVNISARQINHANFVEQVLMVLDRSGANPRRLKLELTESLLVNNVEDIIGKMTTLKAKGVGFSLDDFGTGYSSLAYLKRLPLDQLKIDQSFVRDILTDSNDAAIAKMIVVLAGSMGLTVIAEGVETAAQRDSLAQQGCHAYQGYFFSRPVALDAFEVFVKHSAPRE